MYVCLSVCDYTHMSIGACREVKDIRSPGDAVKGGYELRAKDSENLS